MPRTQAPDRVESETIDGKDTKLYIYYTDPEYNSRVEVKRDESWEFGVDGEAVATLLSTSVVADDLLAEPELPEWLIESLLGLGVEEIEGEA